VNFFSFDCRVGKRSREASGFISKESALNEALGRTSIFLTQTVSEMKQSGTSNIGSIEYALFAWEKSKKQDRPGTM